MIRYLNYWYLLCMNLGVNWFDNGIVFCTITLVTLEGYSRPMLENIILLTYIDILKVKYRYFH